jgi:phosphoglycerol transferase
LLFACLYFRVWREGLRVPFVYREDGLYYLAHVKAIVDNGWLTSNTDLGWPIGSHLDDLLVGGDNLSYAVMWVLARFTSEPAVVSNLFFLGQFPVIAAVAHVVLRRMGLTRPTAAVLACLYATTPYHFVRGERHIMLSMYATIPVVVLLLTRVAENGRVFAPRPGVRGWRGQLSRRNLLIAAFCVVLGSTGSFYYAVFAIVLLALVAPAAALAHRSWRPLLAAAALCGLTGAVVSVNLSPTYLYNASHGSNSAAFERAEEDTEYYALSIARLAMPPASHRFGPASRLGEDYQLTTHLPQAGEGAAYVGVVASAGLALLLLAGVVALLGGGWLDRRYRSAAAIAGVAFLVGTTNGLATLFAFAVTPNFRAVGRIVVVLSFLGLLAAGLAFDRLGVLAARRRWGAVAAAGALALVLAGGLYDQSLLPREPSVQPNWANDGRFLAEVERRVPGAALFVLPIAAYPSTKDPPPGRIAGYDTLRLYVRSHGLSWSYGALNGRPENWQAALVRAPLGTLLPAVSAVGFRGVVVDTLGYAQPESVVGRLRTVLRTDPLTSPDGRFVFLGLEGYSRRLTEKRGSAAIAELRRRTLDAGPHPTLAR